MIPALAKAGEYAYLAKDFGKSSACDGVVVEKRSASVALPTINLRGFSTG